MFQHEGPSRSARQNRVVAGYLAFVGGFVNSAGFLLVGTFTSHVTGNVGRLASELASGQYAAASGVLPLILAFFGGALLASLILESHLFRRKSSAYGTALVMEATTLAIFTATVRAASPQMPVLIWAAALLCAAMGMQNSLVTRLSGAVVRTTHLTGVFTDLGIEAARWVRWSGDRTSEKPAAPRAVLLATIAGTFILGAMSGAWLVVRLRQTTMALPSAAVLACAAYAFASGRGANDSTQIVS